MSQVEERPILFSAPMVRAILEGRKTVTRRALKLQPEADADITVESYSVAVTNRHGYQEAGPEIFGAWWRDGEAGCKCPYGQPGNRLWVREAWAQINVAQAPGESWVVYRECDNRTDYGGPWKPSIHMRRRDSRILLEITDVRVERLQDISEEQALAEGIIPHVRGGWHWHPHDPSNVDDGHQFGFKSPATAFQELWIGTGGDWGANPWVWVGEFKRVTP